MASAHRKTRLLRLNVSSAAIFDYVYAAHGLTKQIIMGAGIRGTIVVVFVLWSDVLLACFAGEQCWLKYGVSCFIILSLLPGVNAVHVLLRADRFNL